MEPRIQYAKTEDGVNIAFYAIGEGPPFVRMRSLPFGSYQMERQMPEVVRYAENLAEKRKLVRYDNRETGLSQRDVGGFSLDAFLLDLEAVAGRLGLESFALYARAHAGPVAIAYAVRHPEQVSHLILEHTWARGLDGSSPRLRGLGRLMNTNWELYLETLAHSLIGWSEGESAHRWAVGAQESVSQEVAIEMLTVLRNIDVTDLLPQVRSPTLVLHRRELPVLDVDVATSLASRIPNARLALLEGTSGATYSVGYEAVLQAIDEFLSEGEVAAPAPLAAEDIHTILFTDVEGSTALTQRLGDAKARELLREHERMVREALKAHGGSEVKTMGDGFMASFSSATKALECAIAMQRAFAAHNESAEEPIKVRIGLNAGEPIAEDDDLFGTAVNEAARITAVAKGGEILASDVVRQLAKGKDFFFSDRGETSLKGFDQPVRLFEVRWQE